MQQLTLDRLKEVLSYDETSGLFTWIKPLSKKTIIGTVAKSSTHKYVQIQIDKIQYFGHRLAWFYVFGEWPKFQIDHINGIRSDNRIVNLRDVEGYVNQQNQRRPQSDNKTSKYIGVSFHKCTNKWRAIITTNNKQMEIGRFDSEIEAYNAYVLKKRQVHIGCTL